MRIAYPGIHDLALAEVVEAHGRIDDAPGVVRADEVTVVVVAEVLELELDAMVVNHDSRVDVGPRLIELNEWVLLIPRRHPRADGRETGE